MTQPTLVISTRMTEDSLAYLHTTLTAHGYNPRNLTELMRFSAAALLSMTNPSIVHKPPSAESLAQIRQWKRGGSHAIEAAFKAPPPTPSAFPIHKLPPAEQDTAKEVTTIIDKVGAAIEAGVPVLQQLQHPDLTIASATLKLCKLLPWESLTKEERDAMSNVSARLLQHQEVTTPPTSPTSPTPPEEATS